MCVLLNLIEKEKPVPKYRLSRANLDPQGFSNIFY